MKFVRKSVFGFLLFFLFASTSAFADLTAKERVEDPDENSVEEPELDFHVKSCVETLSAAIPMARIAVAEMGVPLGPIHRDAFDRVLDQMLDAPLFASQRNETASILPSSLEQLFFANLDPEKIVDVCKLLEPTTRRRTSGMSPRQSIFCLSDQVRTKRFLLAIRDAILKLEKNGNAIRVVDAGCGAFPVLSLYAALVSPHVQVTAIEFNPDSFEIAKILIEKFQLGDRIRLIQADARSFVPDHKIDLLVSETMASGLINEPIVAIMSNLVPHLSEGGIVLPSQVRVKAGFVRYEEYATTQKTVALYSYIPVFTPIWKNFIDYIPGQPLDFIEFKISTDDLTEGSYSVVVGSDVQLLEYSLTDYDSLLSAPRVVEGVVSRLTPLDELKNGQTFMKQAKDGKSIWLRYPAGGVLTTADYR